MKKYILTFFIIFFSCWLLISSTYAQHLYDQLRQQNTKHLVAQQIQHDYTASIQAPGIQRPYCVPADEVTTRIVMFHYIRPEHWDPVGSIISNNSITPEQLNQHLRYLHNLEKANKTKVAFFSELQNRQDYNCFPHHDITLLTADDGRRDNYHYLYPLTEKYNLKFNLGIIYNRIGTKDARIDPFTTYTELREMSDSPHIEIQSHTISHGDLSTMSYEQQQQEICASKSYLEQLFGTSLNTITYPAGKYNATTLAIAKSCGYRYGLTTQYGTIQHHELSTSPYILQRIRVTKDSTSIDLFGSH